MFQMQMMSDSLARKLEPIRADYPLLSLEWQIFILEFRTGFSELLRHQVAAESAAMAATLHTLEAIREIETLIERFPVPTRTKKPPAQSSQRRRRA